MPSEYAELIKMVDEAPLSKVLPKVLRIAQELHDSELEQWARLELHGYWNTNPALKEETVVPEYRTVTGYYTDDFGRRFVVNDPRLSFINQMRLRFGVVELEGFAGAQEPLAIQPTDFTKIIRDNLGVQVTTFYFYPNEIQVIFSGIRTKLSDLLIARKQQLSKKASKKGIQEEDIIELKPNLYGVGINLRALFRRLQSRGRQ